MMATHWIVDIMSVMFWMPTYEFGGTVLMKNHSNLWFYQKGFILERVTFKKSDVSLNICIFCCLYHSNPSEKIQLNFFWEFTNISKINHMKKVIEDLNIFEWYFRVRQEVSDEIQTSISFIKYDLQTSIENNKSCKKRKET